MASWSVWPFWQRTTAKHVGPDLQNILRQSYDYLTPTGGAMQCDYFGHDVIKSLLSTNFCQLLTAMLGAEPSTMSLSKHGSSFLICRAQSMHEFKILKQASISFIRDSEVSSDSAKTRHLKCWNFKKFKYFCNFSRVIKSKNSAFNNCQKMQKNYKKKINANSLRIAAR